MARTVGTTPGELSISNGVSTYTVPIAMAPGIAGMVPELSLQVSSPGGNGIAGLGGSLSGLSSISRCAKTIAQDGFTAGVNLDRQDGYCLDGQRLILVKGNYGNSGSEYRTEIESFSKITAHGSQGKGPLYFKVHTKSGQIIYYGNSTDSRLMTGSQVISWATNRIQDTTGNAIVFNYQTDSSKGEQYPQEIHYAGNRVRFDYESRPDKTSGYRLGSAIQINQRLSKIVVEAKGSDVRQYRLNYADTNENQTSRLDSVELCSAQGDCLEPVNFYWKDKQTEGFLSPEITVGNIKWDKNNPFKFGDINGDGHTDLIGFSAKGVLFYLGNGDGSYGIGGYQSHISYYFKNNKSNISATNGWGARIGNSDSPYKNIRLAGDINGDGKTDIVGITDRMVYVGLSKNTGISQPEVFLQAQTQSTCRTLPSRPDETVCWFTSVLSNFDHEKDEIQLADVNGDARADIVVFSESATYVAYSQGDSFSQFSEATSIFSNGWDKDDHPRHAVDINGDGRADFIGFGKEGTYVALSKEGGFVNKGKVLSFFAKNSPKYPPALGDINGDGLLDIIGFASHVHVALGKGDGTFSYLQAVTNFGGSCDRERDICTVSDVNGDGRDDLVGFKRKGVYVALAKTLTSTTSSRRGDNVKVYSLFHDVEKKLNAFGHNRNLGMWTVDKQPRMLMDVDGNGSADILGFGRDGIEVATNTFDGKPTRIVSVSDGFGVETHIDYRRLSDAEVYKPSTVDSSYPTLRIKSGPQLMVSAVNAEDGQGGKLTTRYRYADMHVNLQGRGPLGFAWTETEQQTSGITHRIEYHQQWPYSAMPKKAQQTVNRKLVSSSENSMALRKQWNNKVQFPYVKQTIEKTWELNGNLISKVTTKNDNLDSYGNFKTVKVITEGGGKTFTQTTESEYNNNTYLWHLGRLSKATVTHQGNGTTQIRTSRFEYHSNTGLLTKEIVEPHHEKQLTTSYSYDSAGNKTTVTITGKGLSGRTSKTSFDNNRQFATGSSNALGHSESRVYDPRFGVVTDLVGPNKLTTKWDYDSFGRKITERRADGNSTHWRRQWASDCQSAHPKAIWCLEVKKSGAGLSNTQFDKLGRQVRAVATGFDGRFSLIDKQYDRQGREFKVSQPYFEGDQVHWTESFFDDLSRVKKVTTMGPQGYQINVRTDYNGLETTVTNAKGQSKTTTTNVMGKVVKVLEPLGASVDYTYDALGNLLTTKDAKGIVTRLEYDQRGHKIKMVDPAMGTWDYRYNAAGELIWQKDAKQQTVDLKYDALGRLIERKEPEGTSRWIYDKGNKGIGKLTEVTSPGFKRSQTYDSMGRPSNTATQADGKTLNLSQQYDQFGRVKAVNYPMGFEVIRDYNQHGYLTAVKSPLSLIQDYQRRHIDTLLDEVLDRIEEAEKKVDQYYADASRYRAKARKYQQAVESFERYASYNRDQANRLKNAANSNEAIAKRERNAQAADQRAANAEKAKAAHYNNVANYLRNAADRNQASARQDNNRARVLDNEASALERSVKSKRSAGYREYRAARIDSRAAKRLSKAAQRLNRIAAKLESRAKRYQRYADRRYKAVTRFSRRCAGKHASRGYCVRYKRNKLNAYKVNSAKARNYLDRAKKLRQQAATYQVQARGKYNEARKHWQQGAKLIGQSQSAKYQAKTKRKQADQLQAQAKHKNSIAYIQDIYASYSEGITRGANSQANNWQAKANQHASRAQQAENRAKSQRAQANSKDKAAVALDQRAKYYLSLVNAELRKAESAVANAERHAQEIKQLEATAVAYQAIQGDEQHAVYWRAQGRDAAGRLNHVVHGNGLTTQWAYNQATGTLDRIRTGLSWDPIRELEYEYDNNSNVKRRSDITNDINESFNYDALDRLDDSTVYSSSNSSGAYNKTIDYRYDLNGNLTYKSDVGSYSYNGAHLIHAGDKHRNYKYDANGNITVGGGRSFSWSSFNKPVHINKDNAQVNFSYDADRKRYKRVDNLNGTTTTTLYLGKTYEQIKTGNHTTHKYFIYAGDQLAAIHFDKLDSSGDQSDYQTRYLHADALGSVDLITDGVGQIVDKLSYDPFGKRRPSNWRTGKGKTKPIICKPGGNCPRNTGPKISMASLSPIALAPLLTNRGFTGHEHVDAVGIIHMNGRIYDAELGRFLSADPTMQFPYSTQGQNRYAYVQNNPLKYVDMNGFGFFSKLWKGFRKAVNMISGGIGKHLLRAVFRVIGAKASSFLVSTLSFACGPMAPACAAYGQYNVARAFGASPAQARGAGAIAAFATHTYQQIGQHFARVSETNINSMVPNTHSFAGNQLTSRQIAHQITAHGMASGTISVMQGGDFGSGFAGGAFSKGVTGFMDGMHVALEYSAAVVAGGVVSKLGGGKFANGALTASYQFLYNELTTMRNMRSCAGRPCVSRKTDESKSNLTVTGSADVGGQVFGGVFGASVSTGGVVDTVNPNLCSATTNCIQFGLGVYAGTGLSLGGGISAEDLSSGASDSWGFFGNIGAFGISGGGSINFGDGALSGAKGFIGSGKGLSGGVQFCQTSLSCMGN